MNPFIKDHIQDYAEYLAIDNLWIINEDNMKKIFLCFYNWLKWKDYTQYVITLLWLSGHALFIVLILHFIIKIVI